MNYFISAILRLFASLKLRASILTIISANMTARRKFTYPCMVYYRLHMKQWPPNSRLLVETENVCWTMFPVDLNAWFVIVKKKHPYYLFVLLHRSDTVCWSISHIVGCWFLNSFFKFLFWSFIRRLNLGIEPTRIKYISCRSFCYFCLWGIVHSTKWEIDHEFLNNIRRTTDMVAFFYISNEIICTTNVRNPALDGKQSRNFSDDTIVAGLNERGETHYHRQIWRLEEWCSANNLELNPKRKKSLLIFASIVLRSPL